MNRQHLHLRNARLIDPKNSLDARLDLFIADGLVAGIGLPPTGFAAARSIDASGLIACLVWLTSPAGSVASNPNSTQRSPAASPRSPVRQTANHR
jgi:predicted amidohydrolase